MTIKIAKIAIAFCALFILASCGPKDQPTERFNLPSDVESPCDLTEERVGEYVEVGGEIHFVDDVDPSMRYADLEFDDCRVGITVEGRIWQDWTTEEQAAFSMMAKVIARGRLGSFPMPARPEEYQLIVELATPLEPLAPIPAVSGDETEPSLPPLQGVACDLSDKEIGHDIQVEGKIVMVDDRAAAGIYAELESEECLFRLWVERTRWDTWSVEDQALFSVSEIVVIDGILTSVLHEPVVDLSFPPRRK